MLPFSAFALVAYFTWTVSRWKHFPSFVLDTKNRIQSVYSIHYKCCCKYFSNNTPTKMISNATAFDWVQSLKVLIRVQYMFCSKPFDNFEREHSLSIHQYIWDYATKIFSDWPIKTFVRQHPIRAGVKVDRFDFWHWHTCTHAQPALNRIFQYLSVAYRTYQYKCIAYRNFSPFFSRISDSRYCKYFLKLNRCIPMTKYQHKWQKG